MVYLVFVIIDQISKAASLKSLALRCIGLAVCDIAYSYRFKWVWFRTGLVNKLLGQTFCCLFGRYTSGRKSILPTYAINMRILKSELDQLQLSRLNLMVGLSVDG